MKRKRFTEEQIIAVLQQAEGGVPPGDLCRQHGISKNTMYTKRLRDLEVENSKLKDVLSKKW